MLHIRHYIFLTTVLMIITIPVYSQVGERRTDFSIGINGGITMNRMNFSPSIKQSQKINPTFGLSFRYISEKYFTAICGVLLELNYADLGWKELIEDGSNNTYIHSLHYLQMPFLMQMGWGRERKGFKFMIEAGPQLDYCLGTSYQKGGDPWDPSNRPNHVVYQYDHDIDNNFDYGILAGFGLEYSHSGNHILLNGRYYYGLGDTYDNSKKGYFARSANQTIEVKLTYMRDLSHLKKKNHNKTP